VQKPCQPSAVCGAPPGALGAGLRAPFLCPCLPRTTHWSRPPPAAAFSHAGVGTWGRRLTAGVRWPARRVVGEARYPSARGCAGGAIGTETVPAVGGLRDSAGAPWERGDVARTSALPPPNHALERTGHSGHPWLAWGCPCGPPLTASVGRHNLRKEEPTVLLEHRKGGYHDQQ